MNSKQIRTAAWNSLKGKYWIALLASVIYGIIFSISSGASSLASSLMEIAAVAVEGIEITPEILLGAGILAGVSIFSGLISFLVSVFVNGPMNVGVSAFYIDNMTGTPGISRLFAGFKTAYGKNVVTMLLMNVKLFLWMLLLVVPGVIKAYEYAMIPYILADKPELSRKEVFAASKQLMSGNKFRLFKLQISFFGWFVLCVLTLGIGTFFLAPYMEAANAAFYKTVQE